MCSIHPLGRRTFYFLVGRNRFATCTSRKTVEFPDRCYAPDTFFLCVQPCIYTMMAWQSVAISTQNRLLSYTPSVARRSSSAAMQLSTVAPMAPIRVASIAVSEESKAGKEVLKLIGSDVHASVIDCREGFPMNPEDLQTIHGPVHHATKAHSSSSMRISRPSF